MFSNIFQAPDDYDCCVLKLGAANITKISKMQVKAKIANNIKGYNFEDSNRHNTQDLQDFSILFYFSFDKTSNKLL